MDREQNASDGAGRILLDAQRLRQLRRRLGLSQEALAEACNERHIALSVSSIKRAESGKHRVFLRTGRDLANFFGVSFESLLAQTTDVAPADAADPPNEQTREAVVVECCPTFESAVTADCRHAVLTQVQSILRQSGAVVHARGHQLRGLFGESRAQSSDMARALYCAAEIAAFAKTQLRTHLVVTLQVREHTEASLLGASDADCAVLLAGIAAEAAHGEVILSQTACLAARRYGTFRPHSRRTFFGKPVEFMRLESLGMTNRTDAFVGRDAELGELVATLRRSKAERRGHVVLVKGEAGVGKTRLLAEVEYAASCCGYCLCRAHVLDFGSAGGEAPLRAILQQALEVVDKSGAALRRDLEAWFAATDLPEYCLAHLTEVLQLEPSPEQERLLLAMDESTRAQQRRDTIADTLAAIAQTRQLFVAVEDIHWAEPELSSAIAAIARQTLRLPIVLVLTLRSPAPEQLGSLHAAGHTAGGQLTQIELGPLNASAAELLALSLAELPGEALQECIRRAEGNPLFLEQLVLGYTPDSASALPYSLRNLIQARLDGLPQSQVAFLRTAAVAGQYVPPGLLQHLLGERAKDLRTLPRGFANILTDGTLQFVHAVVQLVVYEGTPAAQRKAYHIRAAEWYRGLDLVLEAEHLHRGEAEQATERLLDAAEFLATRFEHERCRKLLNLALTHPASSPQSFRLHYQLGLVCARLGEHQCAVDWFQRALQAKPSSLESISAWLNLARSLNTLDRSSEAMSYLASAEYVAAEAGGDRELSEIHYMRGNFCFPRGQWPEGLEHQQAALRHARKAAYALGEAQALGGLGDCSYAQGKMLTAFDYFKQCLVLCERHDLLRVEAANRFMLGTVRIYLNQPARGLEDALASATLAESVAHARAEIVSRLTAGWILLDLRRMGEAADEIERGLDLARRIAAPRFIAFLLESRSRLHSQLGHRRDAVTDIEHAWELVCKYKLESFIGPWVLATRANACLDASAADRFLQTGIELLSKDCVAHNVFRFHAEAIEWALRNGRGGAAIAFADRLESFTREEPTPWSSFHVRKARLIAAWLAKTHAPSNTEWGALAQQARAAGAAADAERCERLVGQPSALLSWASD